MNFWENVDSQLRFIGMERKELGKIAGFPESYISKGIKRDSSPSVDLAYKIAKALNVSIEFLITGNEDKETPENQRISPQIKELITKLNHFTPKQKQVIFDIAEVIEEK